MRPQPLLDVLGGSWSLGVPVVAADWDADLAAFALEDGSVVLTRAEWEGCSLFPSVHGLGCLWMQVTCTLGKDDVSSAWWTT